jgi:hypothetical protein
MPAATAARGSANGPGAGGREPGGLREQRHGEHRGHDDEVLEQEHGDGDPAVGRGRLAAVGQDLEHDRRARHRHEHPREHRLRQRAEIPPRGRGHQERGAGDLRQADPGHGREHHEQPRQGELEAHGEQEHDDADLGEHLDDVQVGHEREAVGPHEHAGHEQADDARHAEPAEGEHDRRRDREHDDEVGEHHGRDRGAHVGGVNDAPR